MRSTGARENQSKRPGGRNEHPRGGVLSACGKEQIRTFGGAAIHGQETERLQESSVQQSHAIEPGCRQSREPTGGWEMPLPGPELRLSSLLGSDRLVGLDSHRFSWEPGLLRN